MATMANWNGHTFEVSANLIRCFEDFSVKGSCETEAKKKKGYVKRKKGEPKEITLNLPLSALLGVTDVRSEAMAYVNEAYAGKTDYFYTGTQKLFKAKVMLTSAEISEVVTMPGVGQKWISCVVKLTFKQSTNDSSSSSSSGKKKKKSVKRSKSKGSKSGGSSGGTGKKKISGAAATIAAGKKVVKDAIKAGKAASKDKVKTTTTSGSGVKYYAGVAKKAQTTKNTSQKTSATTGRKISGAVGRVTAMKK